MTGFIQERLTALFARSTTATLAESLRTEADFAASTGWWGAAGLSLPEPRTGATFAANKDEVEEQTMKVLYARYKVPGWPLAVVTGAQTEED